MKTRTLQNRRENRRWKESTSGSGVMPARWHGSATGHRSAARPHPRAAAAAIVAMLAAAGTGSAAAQSADDAPPVDEIVDRANYTAYYQGKDGRARVRMTIHESSGATRNREFTILRRDKGPEDQADNTEADRGFTGEQNFYVYFHRPPDVREMVYMVHKHLGASDDRWLYLPGLDLVKRIAASDKRTSFVGSDFFYEDVSGRNPELDGHELVDVTENYYKIRNTPKQPKRVEFDHYITWVHKATFLPIKSEYFDERGKKYREYTVLSVKKIDGYWTATKAKMADLRSGTHTVLEYSDVGYDVGIPADIFTERYLRRTPEKWLE